MAQPGVPEQALERGSALADQHGSHGPLRDDRRKGRQVDPLVAAAGDQHDRCRERVQCGRDRVRLRPLRVVHEAHAVDHRNRLEAVLDAAEAGRGPADRIGRDPEQQGDRDRGQGIGDVVAARQRELVERQDPAVRPGRRRASAGKGQPLHTGRDDPAVDHAKPAGQRAIEAVPDGRGGPEIRVGGDHRIVGIEHERPVRIDELGEPALDEAVCLERAVPVDVVLGHVRVGGHGRAARQCRELQLRQLVDDAMVRAQLGQPLDDRNADIAAEDDRVTRIGGQERRGQ